MKKYLPFFVFLISLIGNAQDIDVFQQFYGRYSYTAIGNTLNPAENNLVSFCETLPSSTAPLALNTNQNVISAYVYWAGSGSGDTDVTLNGTDITADDTLTVNYDDPFQGELTYFSCFKEITPFIQANGVVIIR